MPAGLQQEALRKRAWGRRIAAIVTLLALASLLTFPGRLLLFLLNLSLPASVPDPLALVSGPPSVNRIAFPSESGRQMIADVYHPAGSKGEEPGILLMSPAARGGLENRALQRLAKALARLGYVVMLPYPGGQAIEYASLADVADARAALVRFADLPEIDHSRSVGAGLSYGSGPLLLAAAELPPSQRPSRWLILGGYADLRELLRFATTGAFAYGSVQGSQEPDPYVRELLARSLAERMMPADRRLLLKFGIAGFKAVPPGLSKTARRVADLLRNSQPERFDELYARVPAELQDGIAGLSLPGGLARLSELVHILHPENDRYVPPTEARRLWDALPRRSRGSLLVVPGMGHDLPEARRGLDRPLEYWDAFWRTYRFLRRALYPT